ncbi:MAG: D-alanyl-D-alanine carboxypeptidase/D-alanyl-D-alanine-endopeptidase [Betaproteobacteria bacterium]
MLRATALIAAALAFPACHPASRPVVTPRAPSRAQLQHDIDALLDAPALQRSYWGVAVRSLDSGDTLYAHDAGKLLMPASNLKIVTLAAAADRLGWDYAYETRLFAAGREADGELHGDLLVVGSGDQIGAGDRPTQPFDDWAAALRARGIRRIAGRIIGDDNAWDDETLGFGWSWDDLSEGYAAAVGPLQFGEDSVLVAITPGPEEGASAAVTATPAGGVVIRNDVWTSAAGSVTAVEVGRPLGGDEILLRGNLPAGSATILRRVAVDNPTRFFVTMLRQTLVHDGVDVAGPAVDIDDVRDAPSRSGATLVADYRSPPLSELAVRLMKASQNQYAETLLKTVAAAAGTPTFATGRRLALETVERWGVAPGAIVMADGSGLSRYNYVTADALVTILAHVDADPRLKAPFEAALPSAGEDGTLAARFAGTPAAGNARAKTGSMTSVRALSGFLRTAGGERVAFSILANNFDVPPDEIVKAIDAVVVRLAELR